MFDPWAVKIPWRRERLPTAAFWPGEFHGLYSSWSHKEPESTFTSCRKADEMQTGGELCGLNLNFSRKINQVVFIAPILALMEWSGGSIERG